MKKYQKKELFKLSLMIFLYMFSICIIYNIFKLFKIVNCLMITEIISVLIPIIYYFFTTKEKKTKNLITILIYLFLILIIPFLFGKTYDLTVDGNSYHKTAIGLMSEGWNSIYESSSTFNSNIINNIEKIDLWIDHYPKASYFIETCIYSLTNNIESGKCITFLANISLCLLTISILEEKTGKKKAILLGILIGLNPIVLSQIFTFYVDGLMGICFGIELLLLTIINPKEKENNSLFIFLLSCIGIFVNLKFTGLLYSGLIAAIFYFYWIYKYRLDKDKWKIYKNITIKFVIIFITAIAVIGSSSYIKNTIDHKNPLYPLIGKDKVDIISMMIPDNFQDMNGLEKFTTSLFSKTENIGQNMGKVSIKNPLIISKSELDSLNLPDTRIGGFGPYFGLAVIITIISLIMCSKKIIKYKNENKDSLNLILPTVAIILSIILVGENWWARYIPQLYYLLLIVIYMNFILFKTQKKLIINYLIIAILLINSFLFIYKKGEMLETYNSIENDMKYLANKNKVELKLSDQELYGYYYNLKDNKINYIINNNLKDKDITYKYSWRLKIKE